MTATGSRADLQVRRHVVRVRAHAKINLSLRVLGRRADGYHDLRTVFQVLSLHDTLTFCERPGPFALEAASATSPASDLPLDDRNLVWRAAEALWGRLGRPGRPSGVVARLDKRIPMKAGLGGGSADAAAAIVGLAHLWGANLDAGDLLALSRGLGADVGFFFTGGAALGLGRGDEIYPMSDLPRLGVLLVMPSFDVSTADAYRWVDEETGQVGQAGETLAVRQAHIVQSERSESKGRPSDLRRSASSRRPEPAEGRVIPRCPWPPPANEVASDFEPVVAARYPELRDVTRALSDAGASASALSGSGSSVFGLFDDLRARDRAARALARADHRVERAHTLSRAEYRKSCAPAAVPPAGSDPATSTGLSHPDAVV
jgi:4-diphosphocytidyl-2-C-methyl-D-erythritol kinase